jgi:hypothetical protein
MPYDLEFHGRVVLMRYTGQVTADDIAASTTAVAARADFEDQRFHIVDWSQATMPPLNEELIWATAGLIGAISTNTRLESIAVPDSPPVRAFIEYLRPTLGQIHFTFLPTVEAAWNWIDDRTMTIRKLD